MTSFRLDAPPTLIREIAAAVADELERRGGMTVPISPYLTVDEAAKYFRCERQRVYDLVHAGDLEPRRDGRRLLFTREQLDSYLAGGAR